MQRHGRLLLFIFVLVSSCSHTQAHQPLHHFVEVELDDHATTDISTPTPTPPLLRPCPNYRVCGQHELMARNEVLSLVSRVHVNHEAVAPPFHRTRTLSWHSPLNLDARGLDVSVWFHPCAPVRRVASAAIFLIIRLMGSDSDLHVQRLERDGSHFTTVVNFSSSPFVPRPVHRDWNGEKRTVFEAVLTLRTPKVRSVHLGSFALRAETDPELPPHSIFSMLVPQGTCFHHLSGVMASTEAVVLVMHIVSLGMLTIGNPPDALAFRIEDCLHLVWVATVWFQLLFTLWLLELSGIPSATLLAIICGIFVLAVVCIEVVIVLELVDRNQIVDESHLLLFQRDVMPSNRLWPMSASVSSSGDQQEHVCLSAYQRKCRH